MSIGTKILDATITVHHDEIQEHNDFMPLGRVGIDESIRISLHNLRTYIGDRSYIINGNNVFRITEDISGAAELVINDIIRLKFTKDAFIPAGDNSYDLGSVTYGLKNIYIKGGLVLGSDADGDIYYRHDTKLKRLPIGTSNTFLTVNNGLPHYRVLLASDIPDISGTYLTEEVDPIFVAWRDLNNPVNNKIAYWKNNNLDSAPIALETRTLAEYITYVLSVGGTIQDYNTLTELLLSEDADVSTVRFDTQVRLTDIPNITGNILTENAGIISKRSLSEIEEDLNITYIKSMPFTLASWEVVAGGFKIDFYHELNSKVITEIKDSGGKKVMADTTWVSDNIERLYVPYDYRFEGTLNITK